MLAANDNRGPRVRIFFADEIERIAQRILSLLELPSMGRALPPSVAQSIRLPGELRPFPAAKLLELWLEALPWADDGAIECPGCLDPSKSVPLHASSLNPAFAKELHAFRMGGVGMVGIFIAELSAALSAIEQWNNLQGADNV